MVRDEVALLRFSVRILAESEDGQGWTAIAVDVDAQALRDREDEPYAMPYETRQPILVARGLREPLEEAWRRGKRFI